MHPVLKFDPRTMTRRQWLTVVGGATVAGIGAAWLSRHWPKSTETFIGRASDYHSSIRGVVLAGMKELGITRREIAGKSIMLKPNLVEPATEAPHINTNPIFIREVAEAFRSMDSREVFVAEGPGHCRDTYLVLDESGVGDLLRDAKLPFIDLNHDDVDVVRNAVRRTTLKTIYLPRSLRRADIVVSLPKMKTHHWTGATLSMKNFFGVMPGICYGWPKNVLHREGINESVVDIVGTVKPSLSIVDGIVGMEGDGPIMGEAKAMGVIVMGRQLPAVDATCCRLMKLNPARIDYLKLAADRLGPIGEFWIKQRGESIASEAKTFKLLDDPQFAKYRA